jgi:hypothetical protein
MHACPELRNVKRLTCGLSFVEQRHRITGRGRRQHRDRREPSSSRGKVKSSAAAE